MCMVLIDVVARVVMMLIIITVRTVIFVVFMLLQAGYLSLYGVCTVTARTIISALCSYLLQPEQLCLYGILQEGWACN